MRFRTLCFASLAALIAGSSRVCFPGRGANQPGRYAGQEARLPAGGAGASPGTCRVTVEKRSFLDGGTEVLPGQRKFTDYAFPPGYSATSSID